MVQGGVKRSVAVPVSVPAGMRWQPVKRELAVDGTTLDVSQVKEKNAKNIPVPHTPPAKAPPPSPVAQPTVPAPEPPKDRNTHGAKDGKKDTWHKQADDESDAKGKASKKNKSYDDSDEDASDKPRKKAKRDEERDTATKSDDNLEPTGRTEGFREDRERVAAAPPMPDVGGEVLEVSSQRAAGGLRLTASLGGGVAIRGSADGLVAIDGRAEIGRRTLVGLDAGLWLVGGLDPQGRFLFTLARRGIARYVELGAGAGLHIGDGAGPALSLRMRVQLPWLEHAAPFLRYDGALLYSNGTKHGENAATLGVEWTF